MAKTTTFSNDFLKLIFNGTSIDDLAEDDSTSPNTDLYVSLHTSSPGISGNQTTNECAYTDYERVAVARDGTGWTVTANAVSPANPIEFPTATGGTEVATHFGIGTDVSGTGKLLWFGSVSPNINISNGVQPRLTTTSAVTET